MSYNKVGNGNANGTTGSNGTTYIAQLNAARGYACLIDEVTPLRRAESGKPVFSVVNDESFENSIRERMMQGNQFTRTTTDVRAGKIGKQTSGGDAIFQDNSNWFKSNSMGNSFDKYEVGHGTRPSKLPPSSSLPSNFNLGNNGDKTCTDEDSTNVDSPPYFGEEIDTNSVAATSAAALRKAIEEAQARIKMAKELMERKKAGLKNGVKLNFSDGVKPEERKEFKVAYAVNRSKKKTTPEPCKEEDVPLPVYSGTRQQDTAGPCQGTTGFEVREKVPSAKEFDGKTPWKKISSQADQRWEEAEISEVEQFYEVENTSENWSPTTEVDILLPASAVTRKQSVGDSGNVTEDCKVHEFASDTKEGDRETPWKERRSIQVDHEEEKAELMETTEQFYEVDNTDKNWATVLEFEEVKTMQSVDENEWKERKRAEEVCEKPQHCGVSPKPAKEVYEKPQHCGISPGPAEEDDISEKIEKSVEIPNGNKGESDRGNCGVKSVGDEEVPDHEENERKHQVAVEQGESEEIVQASYDNDTYEENPIEFQEPVKDDKRLEIRGLEDIKQMERQSNSWAFFESEKRGEEACKQEKLEKVQSDAHDEEDNEETFTVNRASKKEMVKAKLDELHLGKKIANILSHNDESEANGEFEEAGGNEKLVIGDGSQKEEYENIEEETCQWVEAGRTETKIDLSVGDEEDMTAALGEPRNHGNKLGEADKICLQDESDNLSRHQKPILFAENEENVEVSQELPACKEGGSISEECEAFLETSENRNERESVKEKYDMVERGLLETDGFPHGLELTKIMKATEGTTEDFSDKHDVNNVGRIEMNFVQHPNDEPARQLEIVHDSREHIEELASETEKVEKNVNESEVAVNQEDDKNTTECLDGQGCVDSGNNMKRPQSSDSCEGKGENLELDQEAKMSPGAENDHRHHEETPVSRSAEENEESCRESPPRQNAGTEENDQASVNVEESTSDNSLQKEVELEKEHLRKIDEAKEREREKEKERIAVERAIREARERAFAEARERAAAGRAAAGARQRVPAEARDRIGKTSAEVNDKSVAEKASKEAKLKAERAAVERATAEARERALEKAMSGKAASDARKQNPQYKGPYSSSTSRYPNSSNHAGM